MGGFFVLFFVLFYFVSFSLLEVVYLIPEITVSTEIKLTPLPVWFPPFLIPFIHDEYLPPPSHRSLKLGFHPSLSPSSLRCDRSQNSYQPLLPKGFMN